MAALLVLTSLQKLLACERELAGQLTNEVDVHREALRLLIGEARRQLVKAGPAAQAEPIPEEPTFKVCLLSPRFQELTTLSGSFVHGCVMCRSLNNIVAGS